MKQLAFLFLLSFLFFSCSVKKDDLVEPSSSATEPVIKSWADVDVSYLMGSWKVKHSLRTGIVDKYSTFTNFVFDKNGTVIITSSSKNYTYYWQCIKDYDSRTKKYGEPRMIIGASFKINIAPEAPAIDGLRVVDNNYTLTFLTPYTLVGTERNDVRFVLSK